MAEAKRIIARGLLAVAETAEPGVVAGLTDEEHGAEAARLAKAHGLPIALAAEKSSQPEVELEYGDRFAEHIEALDPEFGEGARPVQPRGRRRDEQHGRPGASPSFRRGWLRGPASSSSS